MRGFPKLGVPFWGSGVPLFWETTIERGGGGCGGGGCLNQGLKGGLGFQGLGF